MTGTDTFQYEIANTGGRSIGTVTVTLTGTGFFVNNQAAAGGTGTQASPFQTLAQVQAAAAGVAGAEIVVFQGNGTSTGYNTPFRSIPSRNTSFFPDQRTCPEIGSRLAKSLPASATAPDFPVGSKDLTSTTDSSSGLASSKSVNRSRLIPGPILALPLALFEFYQRNGLYRSALELKGSSNHQKTANYVKTYPTAQMVGRDSGKNRPVSVRPHDFSDQIS